MSSLPHALPLVTLTTSPAPLPRLRPTPHVANPPWDRNSPDWQRLDAKLPADHLARQIDQAVEQLDLTALFDAYAGTGSLAHRPDLLLKVVLFEIHRGHLSPAQWHQDLLENEPCQWLAFGIRPSRSRLYAFRDRLGPLLDDWHNQLVGQAVATQRTPATRASVDGSTVAANGSRHRLLGEEGLCARQQALAEATQADAQGAAAAIPGWMADTPAGRLAQQQRYATARQHLEARQRQNRQRPASKRLAPHNVRVSPGDPEAALGLDKFKVYRPLYNVQLMPDLDSPLILAYGVFAQATDAGTLPTMLERLKAAVGRSPKELLADAGYATALDLAACARVGVTLYAPYQENDFRATRAKKPQKQLPKSAFEWRAAENAYVCPEGHRLEYLCVEYERRTGGERLGMSAYRCDPKHCSVCPRQRECTRSPARGRMVKRSEHEHLVEALRERMQSAAAKALYKRRCETVELGFADQKEHRGLRRFRGRGLARARIEAGLVVLAHNALAVLTLHQKKDSAGTLGIAKRSTA
jgi:transposase